jgi:hypothetical protein
LRRQPSGSGKVEQSDAKNNIAEAAAEMGSRVVIEVSTVDLEAGETYDGRAAGVAAEGVLVAAGCRQR